MTRITPAIMIGGIGSRLWPLSRENRPKQFLGLFGGPSFFQQTLNRFNSNNYEPAWLMASEQSMGHAIEQLTDCPGDVGGLVVEPIMRGTGAAIAALTLTLAEDDPDAIVLVVPSDHLIPQVEVFHDAVRSAVTLAEQGKIIVFGIKPTSPETGFGYIRGSDAIIEGGRVIGHSVNAGGFLEKPALDVAERFVAEGCLWNAGMFLFSARTMLDELEKHAPEILSAVSSSVRLGARGMVRADLRAIPQLTLDRDALALSPDDLPIDIAVMERSAAIAVVPLDGSGWNDIGSLSALWDVFPKDGNQNVVDGNVVQIQSSKNFIYSSSRRKVTICNVDELVVVDTDDALLVISKKSTQNVKKVVASLKASGSLETHDTRNRHFSWGRVNVATEEKTHRVCSVTLKAGQTISRRVLTQFQETWTSISGHVAMTVGNNETPLKAGTSAWLHAGVSVSIANRSERDIELVVVQTGPGVAVAQSFGFQPSEMAAAESFAQVERKDTGLRHLHLDPEQSEQAPT